MSVMSVRRRTLLIFFLLVMFGALAIGYLLTFHLDTVQRVVQQQMLDTFGQNLQVGDIEVAFFPSPTLTLTNLQVLESERGQPVFHAVRIQMDLSFLSVLQDEFVPKTLLIEEPEVYLRRNEEGQWNAETILHNQSAGSTSVGAFLTDYSLTIENGFIQIVDAFEHSQPETIELNRVALDISNLSAMKPMDVSFSANVNGDDTSHLSFQGTISHAYDLFTTSQEAKEPSGPNVDVRTQIELNQSALVSLATIFRIQDLVPLHHGPMKAQSQIQYGPGLQGYELILSNLTLLSNEVNLQGEASVAGLLMPSPPTISATWSSTPIRIKKILEMVPAHLIPDTLQNAIVDQSLDGTIEVVSATVSGSSLDDMGFGVSGEFKLSGGSFDLGEKWGVAEQVQGTVFVQPDRIQLQDIKGIYDSIPVSWGAGNIEFRDTGPWLSTELQGTVPSKKLLEILRTVFGWNDQDHAMAGFVGEGGSGKIKIRFAGPLDEPENISFEKARYDPEHVTLRVPGIEGPLTHVTGTVTFSQQHVSFEPLKGVLGSSPVALQGTIKFQESEVFDTLKLTGRISDKDLAIQVGEYSTSLQNMMSGVAEVVATISGPIDRPRIQTRWNLGEVDINLSDVLHKEKTVPGTFDVDLKFEEGQRLHIHRMTLSLPSLSLSGHGLFDENMRAPFTASITASPFNLDSLPSGLTLFDNNLQKGSIEFSLKVDGKGDDWRQWNKSGWFALTKGELSVEGLNSPLSEVVLRIKFDRHVAEVKRLQFHMQDSQARIAGSIRNWETTPKVKFEMLAPQFDIDLLIPKGERSPVREALESIAATQTVEGKFQFRRAWYKDMKFQDLHGRFHIQNEIIGVEKIKGTIESGKVQGRLLIHLPVNQPATVKTWIDLENVPFETLQTTFLSAELLSERLITGNLSVQGMIHGHGKDERGIFPTLNGEVTVLVKNGRIRRGTVIPKMLALMNLPAVLQGKVDFREGYPFDKQSGTLTIKNGIMSSKDIVMDGPILKLTGAGTYDLIEGQLDLALVASPLGSYFKLLRKISLFRLLLEGDQESIDMAVFEVKGPINDPVVKSLPLESLKTGLTGFAKLAFNVLKNTITLPTTILFPKNSPDTPSTPDDQSDNDQEF